MRSKKAQIYRKLYDEYEDRTGTLNVKSFSNVIISPKHRISDNVYANLDVPDNFVVDDCNLAAEIIPGKDYLNKKISNGNGGCIIYGGYFRTVWGHFLMNSLARLWVINNEEFSDKIDKIVFCVLPDESKEIKGNYLECFKLLGVADKIKLITADTYFENIIIPELGWKLKGWYSDDFYSIFRRIRNTTLQNTEYQEIRGVFS